MEKFGIVGSIVNVQMEQLKRYTQKKKTGSQITPTPKEMGLSTPGGGSNWGCWRWGAEQPCTFGELSMQLIWVHTSCDCVFGVLLGFEIQMEACKNAQLASRRSLLRFSTRFCISVAFVMPREGRMMMRSGAITPS